MPSIPVTIITGFLGSGKTTLLLNLLPQLRLQNPHYKLALVKNEFGDLAIDSQLASAASIASVRELLNGCICCNLVGSLATALVELADTVAPDRIVIETSGSAFPATLAMEVNRVGRETGGRFVLDGVVTVLDVENWQGYEDTSFTARLQARYTDLIIFNKWEEAGEQRWETCLDRLGDLEVDVAWVKSRRGWVDVGVVFGLDGGLARALDEEPADPNETGCVADARASHHEHITDASHQSEVEVLSLTLSSIPPDVNLNQSPPTLDTQALLTFLQTAPKDEIYRIKAIFTSSQPLPSSDPSTTPTPLSEDSLRPAKYILNWSFGRWTCTPLLPSHSSTGEAATEHASSVAVGQGTVFVRMTIISARGGGKKWKKRLEGGTLVRFAEEDRNKESTKLEVVSIT
ncbi:hypothetical protein K3495_g2007 [Podosphaera aphanis]|nr:hypothetical protein K3495_g2007 [Podosphaera aphanis]